MDLATLTGVIAGVVFILSAVFFGGNFTAFINIPAALIVLGGGIASTLISYRLGELTKLLKVVSRVFITRNTRPDKSIPLIVRLAQKARREGLLSIEEDLDQINDKFTRESLQLVVDGVEPDIIRGFLQLELESMRIRHAKGQALFRTMGALFPAWGLIGTMISIVNMLSSLTDFSKIGRSVASAIMALLYGTVLAYFICLPVANKLKLKSDEEISNKEMVIEGILAIHAGENPKIIESRLMLFLAPEKRMMFNYGKPQIQDNSDEDYD